MKIDTTEGNCTKLLTKTFWGKFGSRLNGSELTCFESGSPQRFTSVKIQIVPREYQRFYISCLHVSDKKLRRSVMTTFQFLVISTVISLYTCKKNRDITLVCVLNRMLWRNIQRKARANTSSILFFKRNCFRYNGALQRHEINGFLTQWRHLFFVTVKLFSFIRYIDVRCI